MLLLATILMGHKQEKGENMLRVNKLPPHYTVGVFQHQTASVEQAEDTAVCPSTDKTPLELTLS